MCVSVDNHEMPTYTTPHHIKPHKKERKKSLECPNVGVKMK